MKWKDPQLTATRLLMMFPALKTPGQFMAWLRSADRLPENKRNWLYRQVRWIVSGKSYSYICEWRDRIHAERIHLWLMSGRGGQI